MYNTYDKISCWSNNTRKNVSFYHQMDTNTHDAIKLTPLETVRRKSRGLQQNALKNQAIKRALLNENSLQSNVCANQPNT